MLHILEFDLTDDPAAPGVPVRMTGTEFTGRLLGGEVMDVPDPTPSVRPITPTTIYHAHHGRDWELTAHYPGRDAVTPRANAINGALAVGGPILFVLACLAALHFWWHTF